MGLHFQYKEYFWLLIAVVILVSLFLSLFYWKKRVTKRIGDKKLVKALTADYSSKKFLLKFVFLAIAFILGVFAVMNLRKAGESANNTRKGIDIVIALDVSKSMLATDLAPNRLERAKQFIGKLMSEMPDDRIALVLFAGKAYLQMPLTIDHGAAQLFVSSASPDAIPQQGTVISDALNMSTRAFNANDRKFKSVVLISDGEDHDADAVTTANELAEQGVMINTVGIGSANGATISDPLTGENKRDNAGNIVISKLNENVLKEIAGKTNGVYVKLESSDEAVTKLKGQLSQIERKAFGDMSMMNFRTFYCWFIGLMLVILVVENFISEKKVIVKEKERLRA
ncbi:MAG: VWA domain-containing protein [Chitinophagaceae bacterium]